MIWAVVFSRYFYKRINVPEWDRTTLYMLWCLKFKIDRAWIDDRQWNPLNWVPVIHWRRRHPIWITRMGCRIDRLMLDRKLGILWLSRTLGDRAVPILVTKRYKQAQAWAQGGFSSEPQR